jgi:hypothetical protein
LSLELRLHRYGNARSRMKSFVPTVNPHDRESAMQTITKHYIDAVFVESHGREVMDLIKPTNGKVISTRVSKKARKCLWAARVTRQVSMRVTL